MLSIADVAAGGVGGVAAEQMNKFIEQVRDEEAVHSRHFFAILAEQRDYLRILANALSPALTPPENDTVVLQAYPQSWPTPEYRRQHFCIFLPSGASGTPGAYTPTTTTAKLYLEVPGCGTIIKTINAGWNQLDLPPQTLISSADGNQYTVIYSFRDDAIGTSI